MSRTDVKIPMMTPKHGEMIPFLRDWVSSNKMSQRPFVTVKKALKDPLLLPKLQIFKAVSFLVEPFLKKVQSSAPLFPLLYEEIATLIRSLMIKFIKPETLREVNTLAKLSEIDMDSEMVELPDVGFASGFLKLLSYRFAQ